MKRRGNKSSKVPNVKLRPAQEGAVTRLQRRDDSTVWADDSQLGSDDTSVVDLCPRPFRGFVLCATGINDKTTLFKQALELGATSTSAFTDRVTHLVAERHGGAKYYCALERKIPILKPSWITESYQIWLRGDDVEVEESIQAHRLPIFSDVVLCISGIMDITRRTQIHKYLTSNGGVYMKNLERPVKVTHLLCSGDEETDKMRYAEKFNGRGEANVHLVWEEWFWDSLEFGGRFDEEKYQVRHPRPERKSLPEASSPPPSSAVLSEQQEETAQDPPPQAETEEEPAAVRRLPAATLQLWSSLLTGRGYEISDGALVRSPSKVPRPPVPHSPPKPEKGNGNVISQFRRSNSFAPARPEASSSGRPQPFRRTQTVSAMDTNRDAGHSFMASARKNGESSTSAVATASGIFAGLRFVALGEAKSLSVRVAIEENGGRMVLDMEDEDVDFIIVRLVSGSKLYREELDEFQRVKYRTECWLERCVFQDRVCPPEEHITFLPLNIEIPVAGAESVSLSFSGLDQAEATWIKRLLRALGINLEQFFSRRSTHLLCPSATGPKFEKACQWGTPVVTMDWLATIATTGSIPASSDFSVPSVQQHITRNGTEEVMEVDTDAKGKGKAVDKGKGKILVESSVTETLSSTSGVDDNPFLEQAPQRPTNSPVQNLIRRQPTASPRRTPLERITIATPRRHRPPPSTLSPVKSQSEVFPFGKPTGALGLLPMPQKQPAAGSTPSRTRSTPIIHTTPNTPQPHRTHPRGLSAPRLTSNPDRRPTPREIEREKNQARIPSSKSPSPLKIPPQPQNRMPTESPTRIPREVAKALEEHITTLLGKRQQSDEELVSGGAQPGKRQRRQRPTRVQSRQPSEAQVAEIPAAPLPAYDDSMLPYQALDELNVLDDTVENSMRVTYEDPKQQEEAKRLMSLLHAGSKVGAQAAGPSDWVGGKGADPDTGKPRTRKSARIAGF
ncbi:putative twin BRCT domain containing protein [Lyophyllum shimeji]|uniref:Twin BRCT domain containing protein n=1 Tax=Lyophyllum shimeji TaxID=47721 RepID=A0A9P3PXE1_LYOSH|nr:putative twin BRCT domain containing protein [Lyophyllum shimeji]